MKAGRTCVSLVNVVDITHSDAAHLIDCHNEVTPEQSSIQDTSLELMHSIIDIHHQHQFCSILAKMQVVACTRSA